MIRLFGHVRKRHCDSQKAKKQSYELLDINKQITTSLNTLSSLPAAGRLVMTT
jgi:hypothetical protein